MGKSFLSSSPHPKSRIRRRKKRYLFAFDRSIAKRDNEPIHFAQTMYNSGRILLEISIEIKMIFQQVITAFSEFQDLAT